MLPNRQTISDYRGLAGRPRWGVQTPSSPTKQWLGRVRDREEVLRTLADRAFTHAAESCRTRIQSREDAMRIDNVIESFALTAEALRRCTGMSYYDVQLLGGFVLAAGTIAEIQTGEGKTITTALPAVLHAWTGRGVHVATTNDYLSGRDHELLQPVFEYLGLTSAQLQPQGSPVDKTDAYRCDITYGPGYEFGFDFLKDQLAIRRKYRERLGEKFLRRLNGVKLDEVRPTQREHAFAIIDEADSVLIDEATTPLILSGGKSDVSTSPDLYRFAREVAIELRKHTDYQLDTAKRSIQLTGTGWNRIHQAFDSRPAGQLVRPWNQLIENALQAELILRRDVDYVVKGGVVLIVDQNTGRIHDERKWSSGLHQAVETKEGVEVTDENETHARITRQRYLGFYPCLSGLTGTASDAEHELRSMYRLPVVEVPTHRLCIRKHLPLRCFDTLENKFAAIADDTAIRRGQGQPVLIGTRTIDESNRLSERLHERSIPHVVLNGLQNEEEASIVARAGKSGAVTVATNMAGRGTDIKPDHLALSAGGLHVTGSEVHFSGRVDRQLAGRAARQGDPGSCQFYVSAEDEMIRSLAPSLANQINASAGDSGETQRDFSAEVHNVQKRAESTAVLGRQHMVAHDDWMESVQSSLARRA